MMKLCRYFSVAVCKAVQQEWSA